MMRFLGLLILIMISSCSNIPGFNLNIKVMHSEGLAPEKARQIFFALTKSLEVKVVSGDVFIEGPRATWTTELREACENRMYINKKFCHAEYLAFISNRQSPRCPPDVHPIIENCINNQCTYEIGPDVEESSLCW
jgi:hypothetical protein